ncbi:Clavaminate synthase-like protein [Rickenella mellea]|uniref:Clavaminate synthase-like protein n=1 Tax=Rickenella mellea TaxID=50990 RepID=A0A4Y7Q824_9AGAM|nr:Clavaminate synthase-like protein [Rickenella mellea]
MSIPVIDISPFLSSDRAKLSPEALQTVESLYDACTTWGFFQITGHNISPTVVSDLETYTKDFFALPLEEKLALHVRNGGVAWRGYMPFEGERTHGKLDAKEGLYVGPDHPSDHPLTGMPLHGANQFPDTALPLMRHAILSYLDAIVDLGKSLTDAFSLALGLEREKLRDVWLTPEPVSIMRCFRYSVPEVNSSAEANSTNDAKVNEQGIGEHTDFGYLTILKQETEGLQVYSKDHGWVPVPVIKDAFVCNVGDMFDMLTNGRFKSVPHRVVLRPGSPARLSWPFFFDFSWNAPMRRLHLPHPHGELNLPQELTEEEKEEARVRWTGTTFKDVGGEWWQYLAKKVMKVFPDLKLPDFENNVAPSSRFAIAVPTGN